ncbi:MAG: hypothetical protein JXA46_13730 [Dehalococcoidales bacterium]|nr:hypothetical protein [Dehalococcoidales bacterium]
MFTASKDEDQKAQINILEKAFRGPLTQAVKGELNKVRHNSLTGVNLLGVLKDVYLKHNMQDWADRRSLQIEDNETPRIMCSEALV